MELFKAHQQWATRPADERFETLEEMYTVTKEYAQTAKTATVAFSDLRVETVNDEVQLTGKSGNFAKLTHWSFGQLAKVINAPGDYLRNLPATLAVQNLNYGLKHRTEEGNGESNASLLFHQNGSLLLRSILTERYNRIWNWEYLERIKNMQHDGWKAPKAYASHDDVRKRPATKEDVMPGSRIKEGDIIAPAGLYASDHDMFAFLVNPGNPINDGSGNPIYRGMMFWNSEVGSSSIGGMSFLFQEVCGNHIVWGAKNVQEFSLRHIGNVDEKAWFNLAVQVKRYAQEKVGDIELTLARAKTKEIAATKDEVLDYLFGKRIASRKILEASYESAERNEIVHKATPNSVWGFVQGMTRVSQESDYADQRMGLDKAAGKVMEMVF